MTEIVTFYDDLCHLPGLLPTLDGLGPIKFCASFAGPFVGPLPALHSRNVCLSRFKEFKGGQ